MLGADSADSMAASSMVAADGAGGCEGAAAGEGSAGSPLGVASVSMHIYCQFLSTYCESEEPISTALRDQSHARCLG